MNCRVFKGLNLVLESSYSLRTSCSILAIFVYSRLGKLRLKLLKFKGKFRLIITIDTEQFRVIKVGHFKVSV